MTELERRAMLGDRQAQEECTRRGIVLPCPFCGGTGIEYGVCGRDIKSPCYIKCESCGCEIVINERKMVIAIWNTRHTPPIGRCGECVYSRNVKPNGKGFNICPASGMEITETDFCSYFEPETIGKASDKE